MDTIIAYCGLVCSDCPAYIATQAGDDDALERVAAQWRAEEDAGECGEQCQAQRELSARKDQGLHITPYKFGNIFNHEPGRPRKLLVHQQELKRLTRKVVERGLTLVPLSFYLSRGIVKLELGVCKGKRLADKREAIKRRDQQRDAQRALRDRND